MPRAALVLGWIGAALALLGGVLAVAALLTMLVQAQVGSSDLEGAATVFACGLVPLLLAPPTCLLSGILGVVALTRRMEPRSRAATATALGFIGLAVALLGDAIGVVIFMLFGLNA